MPALLGLIEQILPKALNAPTSPWALRTVGALDLLPASTAAALKESVELTRGRPRQVTLGIGYDPHEEITEAFRALLNERDEEGTSIADVAGALTVEDVGSHLTTSHDPDIDLIIRTSGEQRVSGFFPWQSTRADLHVCDVYWPAFREIDFLRALRTYAARRSAAGR